MSTQNMHVDRDLDLSNSGRGVWLVKVVYLTFFTYIKKLFILLLISSLSYSLKIIVKSKLNDCSYIFISFENVGSISCIIDY